MRVVEAAFFDLDFLVVIYDSSWLSVLAYSEDDLRSERDTVKVRVTFPKPGTNGEFQGNRGSLLPNVNI